MPFVKRNDSQDSQPPTEARKIFIGRTSELLFFVQNILQPDNPTYNIVAISGQGGVGKSTLLARLIDEVHSANFNGYCLAALVDERQATAASLMEKLAEQLRMKGEFVKELHHYKERLRRLHTEQERMRETLLQKAPDVAGAAVEGIPFAGPLLREGTRFTAAHLLSEHHISQLYRDAEHLDNPLAGLTKAFAAELNVIADARATVGSSRQKRQRRVILLLDTFEQLAQETVPWSLDYFLEASISSNVVLVIAGRDPLERSTPNDFKRWLPFYESGIIYSIALHSFTENETHAYLFERGITEPARIDTIWQLSQGLPLYLGLLTSNPEGSVDPTQDVVDNFLRWIPGQESIKRRLALDAALFSRPFNQDDLEAFAYVPEHERLTFYRWLIGQSFVRSQDGRYSYHDLAKELFGRHLYEYSRKEYFAIRKVLALHYQRMLEEIQKQGGKEVSNEWLALVRALVFQLFLLLDEASQIKAIELVLSAYRATYDRSREIAGMLRELSGTYISEISLHARQVIKHLSQLIGHPQEGRRRLETDMFLLHTVASEPSFPSELLAVLYQDRGWAYRELNEHQRASDDFQRALALLDPLDHRGRGGAYWDMDKPQQAIREYTLALELNPSDAVAYRGRGWNYYHLKEYQQAINDFERALELDSNQSTAYNGLGQIYKILKEYAQALAHFEREVEVRPTDGVGYALQGEVYIRLKEFRRAMALFDRALELSPWNYYLYYMRGRGYLWLRDLEQALADFTRSYEHLPIMGGWMAEWVRMCQREVSSETLERLEELIASVVDPTRYYPRVCQGVLHLLHQRYKDATAEFEKAIPLPHDEPWDAYFWKGIARVFLGQEEEAMEAIEKALEEGMPPVLLAPLRWFEKERHNFYEQYIVLLLAKYA
jgi:tetratricopeptide (TPR) repeat protein